jgi:hypothetical protein
MTDEEERDDLLAELAQLRPRRDVLQAQLDAIDGRRWDVFQRLKELKVPNRELAAAYSVSEPAIVKALKRARPQPAARQPVAS